MGRRRRRKRRLEGRTSERDMRSGRYVEVLVARSPRGSKKGPVKVTKKRRRNGNVTKESYEL